VEREDCQVDGAGTWSSMRWEEGGNGAGNGREMTRRRCTSGKKGKESRAEEWAVGRSLNEDRWKPDHLTSPAQYPKLFMKFDLLNRTKRINNKVGCREEGGGEEGG